MKADKKLKQIVKKSGKQRTDIDFRQSVFDTYSEQKQEFKIGDLLRKTWFKATVAAACCAAVVLTAIIGLQNREKEPQYTADVVVIDNYDSNAVAFNKEGKAIDNGQSGVTINYLDKVIDLNGCNIDEDNVYVNQDTQVNEYRYIMGGSGSDLFQIQVVLNGEFNYSSQLSGTIKNVTINDIDFDYCIYYAKNDKMYYLFAESKSENGAMLVGFVTTQADYESHFKTFLFNIIK